MHCLQTAGEYIYFSQVVVCFKVHFVTKAKQYVGTVNSSTLYGRA